VPESDATCIDTNADFRDQVEEAIQILQSEHPEIFEGISVVNVGAYIVGLIEVLDRMNLCAAYDGEELNVKANNDYSEHYDILTAKRTIRTGPKIYKGTCEPAVFPQPEPPLPPPPAGCPLPSSREIACGREPEGRYYWDVEHSIDELYVEHPELFNFNDYAPGQGDPAITDIDAYNQAMIDKLVSKGYCAIFDGEEIQMKATNEFTEHYDVNYQDKYVRRGPGIYRGSCYPAAF